MNDGSPEPPLNGVDRVRGLYLVFANECAGIRPVESLTLHRSYQLELFLTRWTAEDLRMTLKYLRRKFYRKDKPEYLRGMLHFRKLFGDPDFEFFEEYWLDAKADQRNAPKPTTQRETVLREANLPAPETQHENGCKRFGDWMEQNDEWKTMKKNLGL